MNVRCRKSDAQALTAAVKAARGVEKKWLEQRRAAVRQRARAEKLPVAARDLLLDEAAAEFAGRRAAGDFRGTRTLYVLPSVHTVLDELGWKQRRWRPVPRQRGGRPWGAHDEHFDARVALYLPDELAELITRACYWTSRPAVLALGRWYDEHGDHWRGRLHDPDARWVGAGPSHADLHQREQLISQVVTTGQVLREALHRALTDGG